MLGQRKDSQTIAWFEADLLFSEDRWSNVYRWIKAEVCTWVCGSVWAINVRPVQLHLGLSAVGRFNGILMVSCMQHVILEAKLGGFGDVQTTNFQQINAKISKSIPSRLVNVGGWSGSAAQGRLSSWELWPAATWLDWWKQSHWPTSFVHSREPGRNSGIGMTSQRYLNHGLFGSLVLCVGL